LPTFAKWSPVGPVPESAVWFFQPGVFLQSLSIRVSRRAGSRFGAQGMFKIEHQEMAALFENRMPKLSRE
jgi:hypothetical protein